MKKDVFREKSKQRLTSPEQLNDYIKVTNPGVWMILVAIILLLLGLCTWGFLGKIETKLNVVAISDADSQGHVDHTYVYVKETDISKVTQEKKVNINSKDYDIATVSSQPISITESTMTEYARKVGNLALDEWVYRLTLGETLDDGVYRATIIIESVSPFSFVFN